MQARIPMVAWRWWLAALLALATLLALAPARAAVLDEIELMRAGADAVVRIRFGVPVQLLRSATPAPEIAEIFVQLPAGSGTVPPADEQLRLAPSGNFPGITVLYPAQLAGGAQRIVLRFSQAVRFTVRGGGPREIDVVVVGAGQDVAAARVRPVPAGERYAIVLQRFASSDMREARPVPGEFQDYTVFTSQSLRDGRVRHELLLGYFASSSAAEAVRRRLTARFPEAELVDLQQRRDDSLLAAAGKPAAPAAAPRALPTPPAPPLPPIPAAPAPAVPLPTVPPPVPSTAPAAAAPPATAAATAPAAPILAPAEVETRAAELMQRARAALAGSAAEAAVEALNALLTLPPNSQSQPAQELIGLARERNREPAKARAEYELYLKLFPTGAGAERVRQRLAALGQAPAATAGTAAPRERPPVKTLTAGISQYYFGGKSKIENVFNTPTTSERSVFSGTDQSLLLSSVDLNGRYRNAGAEQRVVLRDTFTKSFLADRGSFNRLYSAYYDYRGIGNGFNARLGRQSALTAALPNRFDGALAGYAFAPWLRSSVAAGVPVEFYTLEAKRRFGAFSAELTGLAEHWHGSLYGIRQDVDGIVDRQAVGSELRYLHPDRTLYAVADYDTSYRALNAASLQGSWTTPGRTSVNLLWDRRRAPTLSTTNAVFGQPTTSIRTLLQTLSEDDVRLLARSVTPVATQGLVGVTTPLSEHWQVGADARLVNVGALPEVIVNGVTVAAQPATGNVLSYSLQAIGSNLYSRRDSNVATLMFSNAPTYRSWLLSYNNATGLFERWSFEPVLRLYWQDNDNAVRLWRVSPELRLAWRPTVTSVLELDALWERSRVSSAIETEIQDRTFFSVGYRLDF